MKLRPNNSPKQLNRTKYPLQLLTGAALLLPAFLQPSMTYAAAEEDSVDFQYSHFQEGRREGTHTDSVNIVTNAVINNIPVANSRDPIEVDSLHGSARVTLTDRIKFAFNYVEDTWSGATPFGSAPERSGALSYKSKAYDDNGNPIIAGASAYDSQHTYLDSKGNAFYQVTDPATGKASYVKDRTAHVMSYASPETRKQSDFKLGYEWNEAALDVGGGISTERDYESRFVNLGGRMDFNQKQTTLNLGLSYTNSDINAIWGYDVAHNAKYKAGQVEVNPTTGQNTVRGNRQDWATHLGLTQVISSNALMELGMGYTRNTGFLENPYKLSWMLGVDPSNPTQGQVLPTDMAYSARSYAYFEQRPDQRNLLNCNLGWTQYVQPLDAALHANYQFAHDDWGINAHTFSADWVQPLGAGWTMTPKVRYYSQEAADFYKPYFRINKTFDPQVGYIYALPDNFSSDQRLSGYGALSGGVTVSKQFAKGIRLETGFEYYTHQGALKLGGGGEQTFADYDYWVANAALKVNLSAFGQSLSSGGTSDHTEHTKHSGVPAGLMFAHTLNKAGDMMAGYRYQHNRQAGDYLHGDRTVSEDQAAINGCPGAQGADANGFLNYLGPCPMLPREMVMNMHMLELMYAPTDQLTLMLMLMPQLTNMSMAMAMPTSALNAMQGGMNMGMSTMNNHESGGIGDTGAYALYTLFDKPGHHLHINLGGTAPTGDVALKLKEGNLNKDGAFMNYSMQLGSGTWDLKPSLTYLGQADDWSWGAQLAGTKRLGEHNASGYKLGDVFETSIWGGYNLTHWLSSTLRLAYSWQDSIKGRFPARNPNSCNKGSYIFKTKYNYDEFGNTIGDPVFNQADYDYCVANLPEQNHKADAADHMSSQDYPHNYGGHYLDLGLGVSATVPSGSLAGNKLSFEWLQPLYTNVNGYQLNRDGALTFTWSYGF
jgi:hypothetical protein